VTRDVVVVGAGPAGTACATLLAEQGLDVLVLERAAFPRFHIGESLLPCATPVLDRLGVDLSGAFLSKEGAEFLDERTGQQTAFRFAEGLDRPGDPRPGTWQVERREFDALLLERARAAGVEVTCGAGVEDVDLSGSSGRVGVAANGVTHTARYLVDATGQATFLGRRHRSLVPARDFGRGAAFCHFTALSDAAVAEFAARGNAIKILLVPGGWAWVIPLQGARLSVGFVLRDGTLSATTLEEGLAASPLLQRITAGATRGETRLIGDFSYYNRSQHGPRWACVGDAACFLDPVFSSGVALALVGAARLADTLGPALREGREADPELCQPFSDHMMRGYEVFAAFIYRFYHTRIVSNLFFTDRPDERVRRGIIRSLAGEVWGEGNRFQEMLLASARTGRRRLTWPPGTS